MSKIYFQSGGYLVTSKIVTLRGATHDITTLKSVSVRYTPLLVVALPALGVISFALMFWRYLTMEEALLFVAGPLITVMAATQVGTLHVESLALRDGEVGTCHGLMMRLKRVRSAIQQAMEDRH